MVRDRISLAQIMLLVAVLPPAVAAASLPSNIFGRQASTSTCASGFNQCSSAAGLPGNFCCSADTTCSVLAGNSTVLCCPKGNDCSKISPIVCDLSQQDAAAHPDAPIKTTALNGTLPRCGDGLCCPWGYACSTNAKCIAMTDQTAFPPGNSPVPTISSPSSTSTKRPPMGTASSIPNKPVNSTEQTSGGDGGGGGNAQVGTIVGAVVGVIAGLLLIGILICLFLARQKKRQQRRGGGGGKTASPMMARYKANKHGSTSSFGNIIANPVTISSPKPQGDAAAFRTDFIRKSPMSSPDSSRAPTRDSRFGGSTLHRTPSDASYPATPPRSRGSDVGVPIRIAPIRHMRVPPVTPPAQREPSQEINIFADPSTVGRRNNRDSDSRMTTFTSMMESAALGEVYRGKPFVPDSVTSSPASRRGR